MKNYLSEEFFDFAKQLLRKMRTTCILIFVFASSLFATNVNSQVAKVNIHLKNAPLIQVIRTIENQTDYLFVYDKNEIDLTQQVNINAEDQSVTDVLTLIFRDANVEYGMVGSNIVLMPAKSVLQQAQTISGRVTDSSGEPLPGVTVLIKGTTQGAITDFNGNYTISNVPGDATLQFSFVGMKTQEILAASRSSINVEMKEDAIGIEEVVAIGYGTMKKANLTGAVDQVSGAVLEQRPISNITQGLQGVIPNLTITLADGKPTRASSYKVRGASSIGQGGSALVLIDGVEGDPALLNPNDIEDVSVIKDAASAAIYGSRGAFGVILIMTKSASKEKTEVSYDYSLGIKSPTTIPDFVTDGYTFASMFNEAFANYKGRVPSSINKTQPFSLDYLAELKRRKENPESSDWGIDSNGNYVYYGSTDWMKALYKDRLLSRDHNISISGSNKKVSYYISGRYNTQDGLFRYNSDDYKMYNFRAKGTIELADWIRIENNTEYARRLYHQPLNVGEGGGIWQNISSEGHPTSLIFNPDATLTYSAAYTVGDFIYGKNGEDQSIESLRNTTTFKTNFFNDKLRVIGDFSLYMKNDNRFRRRVQVPYSRKPGVIEYVGTQYNDITDTHAHSEYLATNIYGEYENTFNQVHYVKIMTGFNYEERTWNRNVAQKNGILFEDAEDISLAIGENIAVDGGYYKWKVAGQFYRLNYIFKDKYLFEFNGRLDASSKFPLDQRSAFFPSASAGYRLSEEPFWNLNDNFFSDLKLRASYGALGNGNISPYTYLELFNTSLSSRVLDGIRPNVTRQPTIIPDGLTWETSRTTNFGLDAGFLSGKLRLNGDMYERITEDMYTKGLPVPAIFGAAVPKGNYADMKTVGWELSISWNDKFNLRSKPLNYRVHFVMADNHSEITKYNNPEKKIGDYYEGMQLGEIWGFEVEGLFKDEEDIATHADQSYIRVSEQTGVEPGDIKFKDLNNDGEINIGTNRVSNPGDRKVIGNSLPRFTFGFNVNADWNNFFFSAFFQGVGKQDWFPANESSFFWGQYMRPYNKVPKWQLGKIWTEDNTDAYLPKYRGYVGGWSNELDWASDRYMQNVWYVRLQNVQFGYDLPKSLLSRIDFVSKVRIYFSGENLWNWSPLYRLTRDFDVANIGGSDPDITNANGGDAHNYPLLKAYTFGLSVKF